MRSPFPLKVGLLIGSAGICAVGFWPGNPSQLQPPSANIRSGTLPIANAKSAVPIPYEIADTRDHSSGHHYPSLNSISKRSPDLAAQKVTLEKAQIQGLFRLDDLHTLITDINNLQHLHVRHPLSQNQLRDIIGENPEGDPIFSPQLDDEQAKAANLPQQVSELEQRFAKESALANQYVDALYPSAYAQPRSPNAELHNNLKTKLGDVTTAMTKLRTIAGKIPVEA